MIKLQTNIGKYLEFCEYQKRLNLKTLQAYRIDLNQFCEYIQPIDISEVTSEILEKFIINLHQKYKPKTSKRKIASLKALFHYFEYKELIKQNPFNKIQIKFR